MRAIAYLGKKTGRKFYRFTLSENEAYRLTDENMGACIRCGRKTHGVEPDARKYSCPSCKEPGVYGIEELVMMGQATISEGRN